MSTIDFQLNSGLGAEYRSHSQQARILTETWVGEHIYCPRCGNPKIMHFPNNRKVADFYCPECQNQYELKSKKGNIGQKIADGAYDSFIQRITSNDNPDFLIMSYDPKELIVDQLWIIPKNFFVPDIVERRKPLASTAKRAGWVGCNIYLLKFRSKDKYLLSPTETGKIKNGSCSSFSVLTVCMPKIWRNAGGC